MNKNSETDWAELKAAGWAGKDIHGCFTTDPKAVVSEATLEASCEEQLYGKRVTGKSFTLKAPFVITPRLAAGVQAGEAFISICDGERNYEGRTQYGVYIDLPDGSEYEVKDLRSGCQGGGLQEGMASLLSFLSAAAESYAYKGMDGENSGLFPQPVTEWAYQNSDEISMLAMEIEETPNLVS